MIVIPAIDIKDGMCVRLYKGEFDKITVYHKDPLQMAHTFFENGARLLHIIDLDGAKYGHPKNQDIIFKIKREIPISLEVGGGIRREEDVKLYIEAGIDKVIVGTSAYRNVSFLKDLTQLFPKRIILAIDVFLGKLRSHGWTKEGVDLFQFLEMIEGIDLPYVIYTDTGRDGTQTGPNIESVKRFIEVSNYPVVVSGGIGSVDDICDVKKLGERIFGVIVGKAFYSGAIPLNILEGNLPC